MGFKQQDERDDKGLDDVDTSATPVGYTLTAKFAFSAKAQMATSAQEEKELHMKAKNKEQRELTRLDIWNAQMTVVGGVQMTNEAAQIARRGVIDNADHYARWAVAQGHIRSGEEDKFKETARRKCELEDRRGRGTMTTSEEQESRRIDQSHAGRAVDAATADRYQNLGSLPDLKPSRATDNASTISSVDKASFTDAPELKNAFMAAHAGRADDEIKLAQVVAPASPQVRTTGFGL